MTRAYRCLTDLISGKLIEFTFNIHLENDPVQHDGAMNIEYSKLIDIGNELFSFCHDTNFEEIIKTIMIRSDGQRIGKSKKMTVDIYEINRFNRAQRYVINGQDDGVVILVDMSDRYIQDRYNAERWLRPIDSNYVYLDIRSRADTYYIHSQKTRIDNGDQGHTLITLIKGGLYKLSFNAILNFGCLESMRFTICDFSNRILIDSLRKLYCEYWCGDANSVRFSYPRITWVDAS